MRGAGPLDGFGHNRPTTSDGAFVAGYGCVQQAEERMRQLGFFWSDQRRLWLGSSGEEVLPEFTMNYIRDAGRVRLPE